MKIVRDAIKRSFSYRGTEVPSDFVNMLRSMDTSRLERGWPSAVASVRDAPAFKEAFETVVGWVARINSTV